jgi:hypothetical protein
VIACGTQNVAAKVLSQVSTSLLVEVTNPAIWLTAKFADAPVFALNGDEKVAKRSLRLAIQLEWATPSWRPARSWFSTLPGPCS